MIPVRYPYQAEVLEMVHLMREAGTLDILPRVGIASVDKGNMTIRDPVSEADTKPSQRILDQILSRFPGSFSEEHCDIQRSSDYILIWGLDGNDGSLEFEEIGELARINIGEAMQRLPDFAMHAYLVEKRVDGTYFPIAGILYQPGTDKTWFSYGEGHIEHWNQGIPAPIPQPTTDELKCWVRRVDASAKLIDFYHYLGDVLDLRVSIVKGGGSGASVAALLEGRVNLIINPHDNSSEWDSGMSEPLVDALDGFVCDLWWEKYTYNRPNAPGRSGPYNIRGYVIGFEEGKFMPIISGHAEDLFETRLR